MLVPLDYYRILGIPPTATDSLVVQAYHDRRLQLPRWEYSEAAIQSRLQLLDQAYQVLCDPQQRDRYHKQGFFLDEGQAQLESSPVALAIPEPTEVKEQSPSSLIKPLVENVGLGQLATEIEGKNRGDDEFLPGDGQKDDRRSLPLDLAPPDLEILPELWVGALLILQELGEYEQIIGQIETELQPVTGEVVNAFGQEIPRDRTHDIYLTLALAYREISREQWQHQQYEAAAQSGLRGLARLETEGILPVLQAEIRSELNKLRPYRILELISDPQSRDRQRGLALLKELLQQRQGIDGTGDDGSELDTDDFLLFIQQIRSYLTVGEQLSLFEEETHRPSIAANYLTAYALLASGCAQKMPEQIVQAAKIFAILNFRQDSCLEKSVCALLLGQTQESLTHLRQYQGSELLFPVQDSPDSDPDLVLQDLCFFAEQWLKSELFPKFLDLAGYGFSLQDYFSDSRVQDYLERYLNDPLNSFVLEPEPIMAKTQAVSSSGYGDYPPPKRRIRSSRRRSERELKAGLRSHQGTTTLVSDAIGTAEPSFSLTHGTDSQFIVTESLQSEFTPFHPSQGTEATVRLVPRSPRSRRKKSTLKVGRLILVVAVFLGGLGALAGSAKWVIDRLSPLSQLEGDQLFISMNKPVIEAPSANVLLPAAQEMTPEYAQQLLQTWLGSKADAFGDKHQGDRLATILDAALLPAWRKRSDNLARSNGFWRYEHSLEANSLKVGTLSSPNQANVEAIVREKATYFQAGKEQVNQSYDDTLRVRYGLVRRGDRWLIQSIQVLESL